MAATYSDLVINTFKTDEFNHELYKASIDVAVNRLESQEGDISEKDLLKYLQNLFKVTENVQKETVKQEYQQNLSEDCLLKVLVQKAEKLAIKDVDGSSDPYCLLSVVPTSQYANLKNEKYSAKQTKVIHSTLNPQWDEGFEIKLTRTEVNKSYFQIQLWDYDGETGGSKKVKGVKGMKRYMQEVAQSVTIKNDDSKDDFMGFNSVPLVNIPADGLESWFKLRSSHSLQDVTGRIKVRLTLNAIRQASKIKRKYTSDLLYAGLLRKMVLQSYGEFAEKMKEEIEGWGGSLPLAAKILLHEFEEQHLVVPFTAAIVRWEVYAALHVKKCPGVDIIFMEKMLADLEANSHYAQSYHKSTRFTVAMLCDSMRQFIHEECRRISHHRECFSTKKSNYVINLGNVLLIFEKLSTMGLYQILRTLDPTLVSDVRMSVIEALQKGTTDYYVSLYDKLLDESLDDDEEEEQNELNRAFGGTDVGVLIKLTETLHKDLLIGKAVYHKVFMKILDINYLSYVSAIIEKHLATDASATMKKANQLLSACEDSAETEVKNSLLFRFYVAMRDLAAVTKKKGTANSHTLSSDSPKRKLDSLVAGRVETDGQRIINLHSYHDWFRPIVLNWLQMSRGKTHIVLNRAVKLDSVKRVDDIVKHSSSAVDTVACLTGHVVTFWRNLRWPDPVDAYTIALRLTDDTANAIETYADLVYKKLKDVGFFDDEGQFDVTEALCLALNNLQYVKAYLIDLPKTIDFQGLADAVDAHPEGPSGVRAMTTFTALISSADIGMKKKIRTVTAGVGVKMKPDVRRYLRQFVQKVTQASYDGGFHKNHDSVARANLEEKADDAIQPIMTYLKSNLETLHAWLCEPNFHRILEVLWDVSVHSLHTIALVEFVEQKPGFFYQCRYIFETHLLEFFHAEGSGLSLHKLKHNHDSRTLESELKMRSARTKDLIKLFYMQMYEEQQGLSLNPTSGFLNVFAWYESEVETVHVDVISANNLVPLDMNGLSDPFVQLRLAPAMMFRNQRSHQTLVCKKTLEPVWENETFSFQVERSLVAQEGAVIIFTVLDHDIISANDLEGEAVLPLNILDGVMKKSSDETNSRVYQLPLTQPQKVTKSPVLRRQVCDENANGIIGNGHGIKSSFSDVTLDENGLDFESSLVVSPLYLLRARSTFDKDADEFFRWRRKLEKSKESQDGKN